ncbi:MAG: hypothetical protein ABSE56_08355 [Bryobacteraceae bacterium]|jgi:hypothetical protein
MTPESSATWQAVAAVAQATLAFVLVLITAHYAYVTNRLFKAQTVPAVLLSIKTDHDERYQRIENYVVVRNFSPYKIVDLRLDYGYCGWVHWEDGRVTRTTSSGRQRVLEQDRLRAGGELKIPINDHVLRCVEELEYGDFPEGAGFASRKATYLLFALEYRRAVDGRGFAEHLPVRASHLNRTVATCSDPRINITTPPEEESGFARWP